MRQILLLHWSPPLAPGLLVSYYTADLFVILEFSSKTNKLAMQ